MHRTHTALSFCVRLESGEKESAAGGERRASIVRISRESSEEKIWRIVEMGFCLGTFEGIPPHRQNSSRPGRLMTWNLHNLTRHETVVKVPCGSKIFIDLIFDHVSTFEDVCCCKRIVDSISACRKAWLTFSSLRYRHQVELRFEDINKKDLGRHKTLPLPPHTGQSTSERKEWQHQYFMVRPQGRRIDQRRPLHSR